MLIKIRYPNTVTVIISFVLTWWIINEFEKYYYMFKLHHKMKIWCLAWTTLNTIECLALLRSMFNWISCWDMTNIMLMV